MRLDTQDRVHIARNDQGLLPVTYVTGDILPLIPRLYHSYCPRAANCPATFEFKTRHIVSLAPFS